MWGGSLIFDESVGNADIPLPGGARVFKLAENGILIPCDRAYFAYHQYHNGYFADSGLGGTTHSSDVHRYTLGIERMFYGGAASVEARVPFGSSYDFVSSTGFVSIASDDGIGNLGLALKLLVADSPGFGLSAGLQASLPTAPDVAGASPFNMFTFTMKNRAIHLGPFFGFYTERCDKRLFTQTMVQLDFDLTGNGVAITDLIFPFGTASGTLQDQTLVFLDFSVGYWLYRDMCRAGGTGLLALCEVHYTSTLNDPDYWPGEGVPGFRPRSDDLQVWDLTFALSLEMRTFDIRVGAVLPLNGSEAGFFDCEFGIQINYWFGVRNRRKGPA